MSDNSAIEWTDATWNPVTGCTKVSPGCDHCYAETFAERFRGVPGHHFERGFDVTLRPERLDQPLKWRKPRRVFVNSMSDLFHEAVPNEYIAKVWQVMAATPQHTYQVLTKRHARMRAWFTRWPNAVLTNLWIGVSVEDQKWADIRIPALLDTPAAVRFISAEPLLGPIDLHAKDSRTFGPQWLPPVAHGVNAPDARAGDKSPIGDLYGSVYGPNIDWVIVGGESGPGARPMHPDWARSLRDQCTDAGVPFFFKQWGEWAPGGDSPAWADAPTRWRFITPDGIVTPGPAFGSASQAMHRLGKKAAGRRLDGRTWDEFPAVTS